MKRLKIETVEHLAEEIGRSREHVTLIGSPGTGKTMIARRVGQYMKLDRETAPKDEKIMSHVYRATGLARDGLKAPTLLNRPFRAPHHTVSEVGMTGSKPDEDTALPRYGEMTLAHGGVLMLDELPEFRRNVLEHVLHAMREGKITFGTKTGTVSYPARFKLVAAMNPCPCGYLGNSSRVCTCTQEQVSRYRLRVKQFLIDETKVIDLSKLMEDDARDAREDRSA